MLVSYCNVSILCLVYYYDITILIQGYYPFTILVFYNAMIVYLCTFSVFCVCMFVEISDKII